MPRKIDIIPNDETWTTMLGLVLQTIPREITDRDLPVIVDADIVGKKFIIKSMIVAEYPDTVYRVNISQGSNWEAMIFVPWTKSSHSPAHESYLLLADDFDKAEFDIDYIAIKMFVS